MPKALRSTPFLIALVALSGCDQISPSRYELTKDQSGRTLRLDKRTGEVAVVEGERISPIRDAKTVEAEKSTKTNDLAKAKPFSDISVTTFGFDATLRTSWQDEKLLYFVRFQAPKSRGFQPLDATARSEGDPPAKTAPKPAPVDWSKFGRYTWTLLLEDAPFELAKQSLNFTGVVDDNGKIYSQEAKGSIAMSSETYRRIDNWNVMWRPRN